MRAQTGKASAAILFSLIWLFVYLLLSLLTENEFLLIVLILLWLAVFVYEGGYLEARLRERGYGEIQATTGKAAISVLLISVWLLLYLGVFAIMHPRSAVSIFVLWGGFVVILILTIRKMESIWGR